jgi:hypothetical protein
MESEKTSPPSGFMESAPTSPPSGFTLGVTLRIVFAPTLPEMSL